MIDNPWLLTATGKQFPLLNPKASDVDLADIAQALGRIQRYNGHTSRPYTVAEHSVLVAYLVREAGHDLSYQLHALFHDAAEAYIGDVPTPIKWALETMASYDYGHSWDTLENGIDSAIAERFDLSLLPAGGYGRVIKKADTLALMTESRDLLAAPLQWPYDDAPKPHPLSLDALLLKAQHVFTNNSEIVTPMELFLDVYEAMQKQDALMEAFL